MNNLIFFLIYSSLRGPKMPIRNSQNGPKIFQISHRELETDKLCSKNRCKSRFYPRSVHTSLKIEVSSTFPPCFSTHLCGSFAGDAPAWRRKFKLFEWLGAVFSYFHRQQQNRDERAKKMGKAPGKRAKKSGKTSLISRQVRFGCPKNLRLLEEIPGRPKMERKWGRENKNKNKNQTKGEKNQIKWDWEGWGGKRGIT